MRKALTLLLFGFLINSALAQQIFNYRDTTEFYSFQINYWFNLHHFLWLESFMNVKADSTIIDQELSGKSKKTWEDALSYYRNNLVDEDLRESDYMYDFKVWITGQKKELTTIPEKFSEHMQVLQQVDEVYQRYFWTQQFAACKMVLRQNIGRIKIAEEQFVAQITKLTRQFWQEERLNVDITYVAKATERNLRNRPYTTIFPTHVVMNAVGENEVPGNWLELLFHESAHHLILTSSYFVGGTIKDVTEVKGVRPPRQLWHAYLFYFTGQLTKKLLALQGMDYPTTYMQRNNVFSRYYPLLEEHLQRYMDREITLVDATERIIADLND